MKAKLQALFRHVGALSLVALATNCSAQSGDQIGLGESDGVSQSDATAEDSVAEAQSALISNTSCASTYNVAASSSPTSMVVPIGCARTAPGYHRGIYVVSQTGLVNCVPLGFLSQNPRDGRMLTLVQGIPYQNGTCTITVIGNSDCAHAPCSTGAALDPTCSPNVAAVCKVDPTCCTNAWTSACVAKIATIAEESCN